MNCSFSALRLVLNSVARCGRGGVRLRKKRALQQRAHVLLGLRTLHGVRECETARYNGGRDSRWEGGLS